MLAIQQIISNFQWSLLSIKKYSFIAVLMHNFVVYQCNLFIAAQDITHIYIQRQIYAL
jgi:hypothetical protein